MAQALPAGHLRAELRALYYGHSAAARRFALVQLVFDLAVIGFFIAVSFIPPRPWIVPVDFGLAVVMTLDLAARLWASPRPLYCASRLATMADVIVIVSLLLPALTESYTFLRVLRALRVVRSYRLMAQLRDFLPWLRQHEEAVLAVLNLLVFIFLMTAVVYVTQARRNPEIDNYVDALYFTVTALSTTGFGDITLEGPGGRLLSVLIMVFGISLFVRLAQALFRPNKVRFTCPACGLMRHDPDAVHCKHCGIVINIPDEGA